jgi:hypothetical protein
VARKQKNKTAKPARPTPPIHKSRLEDRKLQDKYVEALKVGTASSAAAIIGFTRSGAKRYRRQHPEFNERCVEAEAVFRGSIDAKISNKALEEGYWPAIQFVAERKFGSDWGKPDTLTIKDVIILCNRIGTEMAASMPFESQVAARRIIDKHLELLLLGGGGGGK